MDWRQYDPAIGRFNGIDKMAESFQSSTPYHYGNNNPMFFKDPSGLFSTVVNDQGEVTDHKNDGDNNVYLNSRDGAIVGKEDPNKNYKIGDQYTYHNGKQDFNWGIFKLQTSASNAAVAIAKESTVITVIPIYNESGSKIGQWIARTKVPFKALKMVGGILKPLGATVTALTAINDINSVATGKITKGHYVYKVGGSLATLYTASAFGGPAAVTVGSVVYLGDLSYQAYWVSDKLRKSASEGSRFKIKNTNIFSKSFWSEAGSYINFQSFYSGFNINH